MTSFFDNSFLRLSEDFYYEIKPEKMPSPEIIKINHSLAEKLNFNEKYLNKDYLSGNKLISGSKQFAQKYAKLPRVQKSLRRGYDIERGAQKLIGHPRNTSAQDERNTQHSGCDRYVTSGDIL